MDPSSARRLPFFARRRARRLAYWNGGVWAVGNGLASTTLVLYMAMELEVPGIGLGISLILAAPRLAGLLRLAAPAMIGRLVDRKRFCLAGYLASAVVLLGLPLAAAPGWLPSPRASLAALVGLWCVYHLLEYLATVALWSWLADLVPLRVRGRFIGRRERWMVSGQMAAMLAAALFTWVWQALHPGQAKWIGYAIAGGAGAGFMLAAVVPLALMPAVVGSRTVRTGATLAAMAAPFRDPRFLRLVAFGCWFSFFNGVTQLAQGVYPYWVLGMGLFVMLGLKTAMRAGQLAVAPWLGRLADRWGNRPVMLACLPLVAAGPLFYFLATPESPWWLAAAWGVWIAYAGLNVCLPNLMLKLSPGESNTPYIATYYAVTGFLVAASTVAGGVAFDLLRNTPIPLFAGFELDVYQYSFLFGWIARTMGVVLLLMVIEPRRRAGDG